MTDPLLASLTTILILLTIVTVFKIVKMVIHYVHLRNDDYEEDKLEETEDFRAWRDLDRLEDDDNDCV